MIGVPPDDEWLDANRAKWEDRTDVHLRSRFYDVEGWLSAGRGPRLWETEVLGDVAGLRLVHLQCHFGLDTLAWARRRSHGDRPRSLAGVHRRGTAPGAAGQPRR